MKISKLYLLLLIFPLFYTCKNEDETPVDPLATCCDIAALDATAGNGEIYAPNVFTPNNDGINDLFVIFTNQNITQVVFLEIKSESGDMIFTRHNYQANDVSFGWDGTDADGQILEGVFNYELMVEDTNDEIHSFTGVVCSRPGFPLPCIDNEAGCQYGTQHNGEGEFDPFLPSFEECE